MIKLPELFIERTKALLLDGYEAFEKALFSPPPVSIRVNNEKLDYQPSEDKVPWSENGYYLAERPLFTADPFLHAGVYYVQEASSMFLEYIAKVLFQNANTVLDLCAAPGGKSSLLSQILPFDSLLVCNEVITSRALILRENIIKWGNSNVIVSNNVPKDFGKLSSFFDVLVIDAPCSGEGMFRKNPKVAEEWSVQNVKINAKRQKDILQDSWNCLKNKGLLVYSTCTFNKEENEDNIAWIIENLGAKVLKIDVSQFDGIVETNYGYRFYPHKVKGEGFFISVLQKLDNSIPTFSRKLKLKNHYKDVSSQFGHYLNKDEDFMIYKANQKILACSTYREQAYKYLGENLNCMLIGLELEEIKVKNHIPSHQLALSKHINIDTFDVAEIDYPTAIAYLKRENIKLLGDYKKGYILLTYKNQAIGWIKNLGTRYNNMYPQNWRIKMQV